MTTEPVPLPKPRILILEDDPGAMTRMKSLAEHMGYDVEASPDPEACLERVRQVRFDAFLIDLDLPRMDGCEFMQKAGAAHVSPNRVIFVTGHRNIFSKEISQYPDVPVFEKRRNWTWQSLRDAVQAVLKKPW